MIDVFIIGSRGYTKKYGGWETLVHGLIDNKIDQGINYYVYEVVDNKEDAGILRIDGITCIKLYIKAKNGFQMIFGDIKALIHSVKFIKLNNIEKPILLTLGARIGPFIWFLRPYIKASKIIIMDNPGGIEWKRPKWGIIGEVYSFISCFFTAKASDYIVCDSEGIRAIYNNMVKTKKQKKEFAAYGVYPIQNYPVKTDKIKKYLEHYGIKENDYYLIINRFMPENSYELILEEFINSRTKKDLILVTNIDKERTYYTKLAKLISFEKDTRIKFVGTMYDSDILLYLRLNAFGYINGHTLGGTNPGLLEAMATTGFVIAYDAVFSREVCGDYAFYFDKKKSLCDLLESVEEVDKENRLEIICKSRARMEEMYSWHDITEKYELFFKESVNHIRGRK